MVTKTTKKTTKKAPAKKAPTEAEKEKKDAIAYLKKIIKKDVRIAVIHMGASSSGMTRKVWVLAPSAKKIVNITWAVSRATGVRIKDGYLIFTGAGYNVATDLSYKITYALYGKHTDGTLFDEMY